MQRYRSGTVETTIRRIRLLCRRLNTTFEGLAGVQETVATYLQNDRTSAGNRAIILQSYLRYLRYADVRPVRELIEYAATLDRLRPRRLCRIPSYETALAGLANIRRSWKLQVVYALGLFAGLRLGEATQLRWSQVDLSDRRLILEESEKRSEGSILPITEQLLPYLETALRHKTDEYVARMQNHHVTRALTKLRNRLLPSHADAAYLNYKALRHIYATRLYATTRDLVYTQRMLRHRSILTTQRYVHMLVDHQTYDVKTADANAIDYISELIAAGYTVAYQTKSKVILRRPKGI
ncbi:MAG: site-specific integrase [Candidatus Caldarchaeum sp.]